MVRVLEAVYVLPSAIVSVEPVAGAVNATLLIDVAVATPNDGVVSVGLVRVLLVSVSVVARPTNVSVAAGRVNVPEAAAADLTIVVPEVVPAMETPFFILNSFAISFHFPRNKD